jgi:hypothetical protein
MYCECNYNFAKFNTDYKIYRQWLQQSVPPRGEARGSNSSEFNFARKFDGLLVKMSLFCS